MAGEGFVFNSVDLNDAVNFSLREVDFTPPKKRQEWAQAADADGSALVRDPLFENRVVTARLRVNPASTLTMDQALAKVGTLVDLLEEAEKQTDGLPLVWTPSQGTKSYTLYVLSGEVTGLPVAKDSQASGWFRKAPTVEVRFDCKPFGYGTAVTSAATVTNTNRFQLLTLASVTGDVPAEGRLVVTDAATQNRRHVEWGLQQRYYDAATNLSVDSFVTTGFAGSSTTRAGSFNVNVIRATATPTVTAVTGTGVLGHVGTFRVKARVFTSVTIGVRLTWQEGDGPYRSNDYVTPPAIGSWTEIDLGLITVPEKTLGTQKWSGRIDAVTSATGAGSTGDRATTGTVDVDYLLLIPAGEGYGKGRAVSGSLAAALVGSDTFTGTVAGNALNTRTAEAGGTWSDAVAGTGFSFADGPNSGDETATRTTTGDAAARLGILGATNYTDSTVDSDIYWTGSGTPRIGVIGRYVDASNYLVAYLAVSSAGHTQLKLSKVIAAAETVLLSTTVSVSASTWYNIALTAYASGQATVVLSTTASGNTTQIQALSATDTTIATAGTLQTGKPGLYDFNSAGTAASRFYDNFGVMSNPPEPIVVYSGRAAEIRFDSAQRQDSTGTYYGPIPSYRGSRFYIPPAGSANRTSRVFVKGRRNDIDIAVDDQIADSTTATIHYTPRFVVIPR